MFFGVDLRKLNMQDEQVFRALQAIREDVSALQIKVGALESILLSDDAASRRYTTLVTEQAERLIQEQRNLTSEHPHK